jgi:thioredoxin 2
MEPSTVTCPHCGKRNRAGALDFPDVVEKASVPVLVDVWASWCVPCQLVSPALEQLATERAGRLKLVKVDVDRAPAIAQRFTVRAVPTLLLINHGQVVVRQSGAVSVAVLRKWLDKSLAEHTIKEARS